MSTNGTPSPATAPAEAPEIKSIQELQAKKADILVYLKNIPNITEVEKQKLEEQYTQALDLLNGKTDAEKGRLLTGIADDISKLRNNLQNEKEDANEGNDTVETDETTTVTEQKLNVENEAKAHLEAFRASIETKLAAPETPPTPTPETTAEVVPPETQNAINDSKEFFANKGVKLDTATPVQGNWFKNILNKILLSWYGVLEGFGMDVRGLKARAEGYQNYESKQKVTETFKVLSGYMGDSIGEITNIADKEALVAKIEGLGLPLVAGGSILADPLMKFIFTGDEESLKDLPGDSDKDMLYAVRGKYLTLGDDEKKTLNSLSVLEKINEVFTINPDKKDNYITRYEEDKKERESTDAPAETTAAIVPGTEETAPETTTLLSEVLSRYDGKAYTEKNETTSNETIFTFEKDDIFVSIKRGGQKETANINPNGTLTYRGITGTPEMIIQLARLDMYVQSLPGKLQLTAEENGIEKIYDDFGDTFHKDQIEFSTSAIPEFLSGWDWQKLYNFLLRDDARQIAPAEAAEMSGEKPKSITQEDLDIIMQRTDVRETAEGAKFLGKIEEDGSITITRATADGEQKWDESIFPNTDGTYTIGNVRFPNITDAIKAANMRNWVGWHEDNGNELHVDGNNIQVDDSTSRLWSLQGISIKERLRTDTNLIKDGKIPEFLTHGTLPETGNNIASLEEAYNFLKGAVIDDGIYGKNKTRKIWESEQITNTNNS